MSTIRIEHGQEFKYVREQVGVDDVFLSQYNLAAGHLEEIVRTNGQERKSSDASTLNKDCLNNIIAFTGNRGQGKTSAMITFAKELLDNKNNSSIRFGDKTMEAKFIELELIDPSTFEDMHNVVEVIITKMYNTYTEEWRNRKQKDSNEPDKLAGMQIMESFQAVYEGLSLVRNPRKFDDLEQDYEGTITKIARAGDSAKLKQNMQKLVDKYLTFFSEDSKGSFLVIPIDDLDVNISLAYKMMEQIRKYLILPNIILIMAVKIDQLHYCVELQFRREMALLIEMRQRIFDQEPIDMATKYIAKLIPDARRIALPELRILVNKYEETDSNKVEGSSLEVEYFVNGENIFSMPPEANPDIQYNFEDKLLARIYKSTGLVFITSETQVHPLVPQTLRELVNFASVLGMMTSTDTLENLDIFENYFVNTWIPSQLDDGYVRSIKALFLVQTPALHRVLCATLLDKLENLTSYTLDNIGEEDRRMAFSLVKKFIQEKSQTGLSLGDVVSLLNLMESRYIDQSVKLFVFSMRTIYSITMRKLYLTEQYAVLSKFVGYSIFGKKIVLAKRFEGQYVFADSSRINSMIQSSAPARISRAEFSYDARKYLDLSSDYLSKSIEEEQNEKISKLLFFSTFQRSFQYFTSGNKGFDKAPLFSLENIFISTLYNYKNKFSANRPYADVVQLSTIPMREVISKVSTNLEFMEYLHDYCVLKRDPGSASNDVEHILHFLNNLNTAASNYLFEDLFDKECVNWIVRSFQEFWNYRVDVASFPSGDDIDNLRRGLEKCKLVRVCIYNTFQERMANVLNLCVDSVLFEGDNNAKQITNKITGQLIDAGQYNPSEQISQEVKIRFNNDIDDLIKILDTAGDEE